MTISELYKAEKAKVRRAMWGVGLLSMVTSLCLLAMPIYLSQVYERVIFARNLNTLVAISVIAIVVLITYAILDTIRTGILNKVGIEFEANVAGAILAGELGGARSNQQTMNYVASIRQLLSSQVLPALFDLPAMFFFLFIVFAIDVPLGFVVLAGMAMLLTVAVLSEIFTGTLTRENMDQARGSQRRIDAAFRHQELVKSQGMFREVINDWSVEHSKLLSTLVHLGFRTGAFAAISKTVRQFIQIALIGTGAYLVIHSNLSAGIIFASSIIGGRALAPIEQLIGGWKQLKRTRIQMKMLDARISQLSLPDRKTTLPRPSGAIAADKLIYAQPGQETKPIIKGISAKIDAGSTTAIIGPSGAGKSTLVRCLVGYLAPLRGRVTLDGQDLQAWDPVARGLHIGYLPQSTEFFEGTVRDNIARLRRQDLPELAVAAAQFAGVHDLIMSFPQGYDTVISSEGFMPSGGQKQLLGLARAFYGSPAVVILDEPNANLDGEGENILHGTIRAAKEAKITTIIVTQRMSIMQFVDKVMLIRDGLLEKYGKPAEVLGRTNVQTLPQRQERTSA